MRRGEKKLVKVCGLTDLQNIREVQEAGADLFGFIFYPPSPRYVGARQGSLNPETLPEKLRKIGVFVNPLLKDVEEGVRDFDLQGVQLHGDESAEFCRVLKESGLMLIKAFAPDKNFDFGRTKAFAAFCDYFLFDTPTPEKGGSGLKFDWELLMKYEGDTPFLLSGGIGPEDAPEIRSFEHPAFAGVDINSRFEIRPGFKDTGHVKKFINDLRSE